MKEKWSSNTSDESPLGRTVVVDSGEGRAAGHFFAGAFGSQRAQHLHATLPLSAAARRRSTCCSHCRSTRRASNISTGVGQLGELLQLLHLGIVLVLMRLAARNPVLPTPTMLSSHRPSSDRPTVRVR